MDLADYESEKTRLEDLVLEVTTTKDNGVQQRSLQLNDLEGNLVELVCFDPNIEKN